MPAWAFAPCWRAQPGPGFSGWDPQEKSRKEKKQILRGVFAGLGRQLAEFCLFPRYTKENVSRIAVYDGFENFAEAGRAAKACCFFTAHFGGWEIGSFAHSLNVTNEHRSRPLDNPYLTLMWTVTARFMATTHFQTGLCPTIADLAPAREVVGILMDTNMTPPQGAFVNSSGIPRALLLEFARVALHTVQPSCRRFTVWTSNWANTRSF